jgi:undecaprenyl-phosphate 4-deoxy-4-formamido-L-arabinose transferase
VLSVLFGIALVVRRLVYGANPAEQGVFTLFAIAFLLIGVTLFGLGLLGEYIGRIYEEVRRRPRYIVGAVLERPQAPP